MLTIEEFTNHLDSFVKLKKGWLDDEQGEPISIELIKKVNCFILEFHHQHNIKLPYCYPMLNGGIKAEWSINNCEASLDFVSITKPIYFHSINILTNKIKAQYLKFCVNKNLANLFNSLSKT